MFRLDRLFLSTIALAGLIFCTPTFAQECSSCAQSPTPVAYGYPSSAGCGSCGQAGGGCGCAGGKFFTGELKAKRAEAQAINSLIFQRNNAFPKPFACADRQLYFSIWEPMIDRGFEQQCVLTTNHFNVETNELNQFGISTVAGVMQNMPDSRKQLFVNRGLDEQVNQARLENVRSTIERFYGNFTPNGAQVAFSSQMPDSIGGDRAINIDKKAFEGMKNPVIPISLGQGVNSAVGGG